ncbi:hypothetical protein L249_8379 [Ophiocordyceps polyrhachis-furcata BCC 54312]|uniref:Mitochondrial inner membrane protein 1 n=1 Tax=Ophiocordyceps polyrhachis-furcata BCC 54312 TaxID=1330021 RepID=A0A367L687_9HYPO|nr:hypothetical protein L249_8379 [Ophiocordyceps polyrhachis-furcata BCC 54312]
MPETLRDQPGKHPHQVSTQSTTRPVLEGYPPSAAKQEPHLGRDLKHDINVLRDTFRLSAVPQESRVLGLTGTLPYVATSLSTLFLAWDLNRPEPTGNSILDPIFIDHDTARYLLDLIEPLQLGYGAVIISFLGAIHWGLEYAEKQPSLARTRWRYGVGVAASVVAWPTVLMPVEHALTAQFMAFVALYFMDSRATARGWAPPWYNTYRFLLTAIVGLAILISLVGRANITVRSRLGSAALNSSMHNPGIADRQTDWASLEKEEKAKIKKEEKEKAKKKEEKAEADRKASKKKGKESQNQSDEKNDGAENEETGKEEGDDGDDEDGRGKADKGDDDKDSK